MNARSVFLISKELIVMKENHSSTQSFGFIFVGGANYSIILFLINLKANDTRTVQFKCHDLVCPIVNKVKFGYIYSVHREVNRINLFLPTNEYS